MNPEFMCQEWIGKGMGYMNIMCNGQDMASLMYFGEDSTCTGKPWLTLAISMRDYFLPENVVAYLNKNVFDPPLEGRIGYGTCINIDSFSARLQDLQCTGHSQFNPFALTMKCSGNTPDKKYIMLNDGRKQLTDDVGVPATDQASQ